MSYRELRNFTEMMRALRFPRVISVENFRTPNFELVADILFWMVKRYDHEIVVHDAIETEDDRVKFLTGIAKAMSVRANVQLNAKNLYAADGFAVKELLKVATLLYRASRMDEDSTAKPITFNVRLQDAKEARVLAREITESGARLHDLLRQEMENEASRARAIKFLDSVTGTLQDDGPEQEHLEKSIMHLVDAVKDDLDKMEQQCKDLRKDEKDLGDKLRRKQQDLDRSETRLESLKDVRPSHMDEYENLELELQNLHDIYVQRFRNLHYLEKELEIYEERELEKMKETERSKQKLQDMLREEELKILQGEDGDSESDGSVRIPSSGESSIGDSTIPTHSKSHDVPSTDVSTREDLGAADATDKESHGTPEQSISSTTSSLLEEQTTASPSFSSGADENSYDVPMSGSEEGSSKIFDTSNDSDGNF